MKNNLIILSLLLGFLVTSSVYSNDCTEEFAREVKKEFTKLDRAKKLYRRVFKRKGNLQLSKIQELERAHLAKIHNDPEYKLNPEGVIKKYDIELIDQAIEASNTGKIKGGDGKLRNFTIEDELFAMTRTSPQFKETLSLYLTDYGRVKKNFLRGLFDGNLVTPNSYLARFKNKPYLREGTLLDFSKKWRNYFWQALVLRHEELIFSPKRKFWAVEDFGHFLGDLHRTILQVTHRNPSFVEAVVQSGKKVVMSSDEKRHLLKVMNEYVKQVAAERVDSFEKVMKDVKLSEETKLWIAENKGGEVPLETVKVNYNDLQSLTYQGPLENILDRYRSFRNRKNAAFEKSPEYLKEVSQTAAQIRFWSKPFFGAAAVGTYVVATTVYDEKPLDVIFFPGTDKAVKDISKEAPEYPKLNSDKVTNKKIREYEFNILLKQKEIETIEEQLKQEDSASLRIKKAEAEKDIESLKSYIMDEQNNLK